MTRSVFRLMLLAAVAILAWTSSALAQATPTATASPANTLGANQTLGFGKGGLLLFSYEQNFDCIDQPTDDLNFNGVPMESDPAEIQRPICQEGEQPTQDPTGAAIATTDKLYVMVPMFSLNNDQNPNDALPCPAAVHNSTICGAALGNTLIKLFGNVPEGFKTTPGVSVQCPNPTGPPGTCVTHTSSLDLFPALVALGKVPATPKMNIFVPTPNHSHLIDQDLNTSAIWWQVITVLVTDPSQWPPADGSSGITSLTQLRAAQSAGGASPDVPSNFFLFFGSQAMPGMNMSGGGSSGAN